MYIYLLIINAAAFMIMCLDKQLAKHHQRRIPEATLLGAAFLGGSLGSLLGMLIFRHKTKDSRFRITVPVVLVAETVFCILFYTMPHNT